MASIGAAGIIAKHLTDLLNTKIDIMVVFDEMFLIEHGQCGKDKILNKYIKKIMADNMTAKNKTDYQRLTNQ
jgi:hypothetical protein